MWLKAIDSSIEYVFQLIMANGVMKNISKKDDDGKRKHLHSILLPH